MAEKDDLRIAMFGHKRIPSREGGVEVVVEQLSVRLAAMGCQVTCYNRGGHHISGKQFDQKVRRNYKGVRIKTVATIPRKGLAAVISSFFAAFLTAVGPYDVVHIHAEGPAFMCWLPKLFGKKVVVTVHGLDHQRAKWGKFASSYIITGERNAVKYADEIIVLSRNVQRYFKTDYGRETVYIPNGVEPAEIRSAKLLKERYHLDKDDYILSLGRIVPEKGLEYLVKAFRKVKTQKKLVIAGGSSDTDDFLRELKAMAAQDDRIIFTGFVQGELLEELYSNSYVYVLPSDLEGMPLTLLEAMSYGNCCLVSDIAECVEAAGNHAVTFQRGSAEDLRSKLQTLCDTPELVDRYKHDVAEFICNKYSWEKMAQETLALYQRLV